MSDKYKSSFRGYLIDHHSPEPPIVTLDKLNPEEYEKFYKEANINSLMVYTKDHWGYSYYDTKIGVKHPGLKLDYIDEVSRILKKNNIEFNAYYCLEYDTLAPKKHPEWAIRDKDGNAVRLINPTVPAKWGMPCYETGYREYVLGQLKEIVENYHPDSLFLDIFGKSLCYCDKCKKKFKDTYGYNLPEGDCKVEEGRIIFDFGDKGRDVNEFLEQQEYDMLQDIIKTVKAVDSEIKVTINFAALYPKKIRDLLDYQFTEPWAGNWLSAAYSRDTSQQPFPQLGPGDVSDVYNYRPDEVYELAGAQIIANGCRSFFYSGSQHVDGTLEHEEARKVGKVYDEVKKFEEYLSDREVIADIAIIQSDSSSIAKSGSQVVMNAVGRYKQSDEHKEALKGAMILCDYSKYSWRIVPEQEFTIEMSKKFKCVVLAGMYHITDELEHVLFEFKKCGGSIIAAGECGLYEKNGNRLSDFKLKDIFGLEYRGILDKYSDQKYGGYLDTCGHELFDKFTKTMPPMGDIQYMVKPVKGEGIGKIINPCTEVTDTKWVNWWCPPPSMESTKYPAIVREGKCYYIAYDIFKTYALNLNRNLFEIFLEKCIERPSIHLDTPYKETVSYSAYSKEDKTVIHVLSNLAEKTNGDAPFIKTGCLRMPSEALEGRKICQVYPENKELEISYDSDKNEACIGLPDVSIHSVFVIE